MYRCEIDHYDAENDRVVSASEGWHARCNQPEQDRTTSQRSEQEMFAVSRIEVVSLPHRFQLIMRNAVQQAVGDID